MFDIDKVYGFFYNSTPRIDYNGVRKYLMLQNFDKKELFEISEEEFRKAIKEEGEVKELYDVLDPKELASFTNYRVKSNMNSKEGRDNLKLDIMLAVWKNENTAKQFLTPGNYDQLSDISDKVKEKRGLTKEKLPIYSPNVWAKIANRMLTGKALIGVGANAAVGHAILQHASKLMLPRAFVFNGISHQVLNQTSVLKSSKEAVQFDYVMIGEDIGYISNITDTQIEIEFDNGDVSYTLVDFYNNAIVFSDKKIAKNLAQYVAAFVDNGKDPRAESVNVNGYTIDVAIGMLMVGVDFETVHYFLSQPTLFSFVEEYLNNGGNVQALDKLRTKYGISRDISLEKYQPRDYSKDALEAAIGTKQFDKKLIEDFLFYKKLSKPIAELIQAVKQGEQGVGPLIEDAIFRLELINSENIDQIIGAKEFLNNQSLMQNKINSVLDYGLDFLVEKAGMIDVRRGIYQQVRDILSDYKSETLLTVNEIIKINQTLYDYLISGFKGVNSDLINELPNRLTEYKKLNPENEYKAFLNRLYVEDGVIVYSGLTGADNLELDRIRESWAKMLHDPEAAELANDLVDYSFHRGGFRISSSSFSSLQPVHFYRMNDEFNSYIKKQLENLEHDAGIFLNQYIRHNWRSLSSVPNIKAEINGVYINLNDTIVTKVAINSDQTRIALDKNGQVVPFIKHKPIIEGTNAEVQLLELVEVQGDYAYYAPALPLGLYKNTGTAKGLVLEEYQYGVIPERSMFNERLGSINIEEQPIDSSPLSLSSSLFKQLLSIEDLSSFEEQVRAVKDKQLVVSPEQRAKLNEHYVRIKNKPTVEVFTWARKADNSYEVSSKGDKRFSALVAKLKDGRTIEEAYQLDVKGYRAKGDNWRLGKGKAPIREITYEQQYQEYKDLWQQYLTENPELLNDLREKAKGKVITDMFASTPVSQARVLAEILNETSDNDQNNSPLNNCITG